jgi:3-keto-L-gulonate-6-phosphate decarboxylase
LPKDAVQSLLLAHGGHHIQQIQQLRDRNYDAEAKTWDEMKTHVYQIADATADALAKQFTKRFS